jgi:RNA polymerase sigma-70 factor (ECF subfamily)
MSKGTNGQWLGELVIKLRPWLLAQAKNLCRNASDADDLVQESFLRLYRNFEHVAQRPSEAECAKWLITTLTHLFYDQCRRQRVRGEGTNTPVSSEEIAVAAESDSRPIYDTITDEQFAQAIETLSPKVRTTFELHAQGQKYQDIARALDVPVGTVAKRLHDARAKLRAFLLPFTSGMH